MAFISAEVSCPALARTLGVQLYFPTDLPDSVGNKVNGVITLLHGVGNTPSTWMQFSSAARYAADNGYILVVPQADNSFYLDMKYGSPYFTALTQQLPAQLRRIFHIPHEREKNFIAGLSMGGYGAMLIGLSKPQNYAAVGSFSGSLIMEAVLEGARISPEFASLFAPVFGDDFKLPPHAGLLHLLQETAKLPKEQQPSLFHSCGLQDNDTMQILNQNHHFAKTAGSLPLKEYRYMEWDGVHEWNFWDRSLAEFIGFIQKSDYARRKQQDWTAKAQIQEVSTP